MAFRNVGGKIVEADQLCEIGPAHAFLLGRCCKGHAGAADECGMEAMRPLISSLISRALGFAMAHGSVLSISILISRPERRSRTGTHTVWVSSSVALGNR